MSNRITGWRLSTLRKAGINICGPRTEETPEQAEQLPPPPPPYVVRAPGVSLYRHFDEAGLLLYVGISGRPKTRLSEHRRDAPWFWSIATIKMEVFPDRASALQAEREAVQNEKPLFNTMLQMRGFR
jgi:hypothetical protein